MGVGTSSTAIRREGRAHVEARFLPVLRFCGKDGMQPTLVQEGLGGGHYDIFMSPQYTRVARGFYVGASTGVWLPQDFYPQ